MKTKLKEVKNFIEKHKTVVIAVVVVLLIAIIAVVVLAFNNDKKEVKPVKKAESETVVNNNEGIIKEEVYQGLKFSNITLIKEKETDVYTLSMDVTNTTKEVSNITQVDIPIKNKNGEVEVVLLGYIGEGLKPNEVRTVTASVTMDISKAVSKEIKEHKAN